MKRQWSLIGILFLLLGIICIAGLWGGSAVLSLNEFIDALLGRGRPVYLTILWTLRVPRVLAGILAGIGLSVAGVLLQAVTANELASPNIIGINSGAGFAVILFLTFFPLAGALLPLAAFVGAFSAALFILAMSNRLSGNRVAILLIGIAITTLLNAAISFLSLLDEGILAQYNYFTVGSLKSVQLGELLIPLVVIAFCFLLSMFMAPKLGILCLGDSAAMALGVNVKRLRVTALACAAASAAAVVSYAGLLGFVGLVVPHITRRLTGERPVRMLPVSALLGAILVVLADLVGRTLFAPSELPVGILMSLIGAPFFLILLFRRKNHAGVL